jgi:F420-non-reducing hydrogenase small subunit
VSKPKVAFYWCASCGGCEETVVDLAEDVLKVVEAIDIIFWPVAMDFKREDVAKMADGEIAVCFLNGAIRTTEQYEMAEMLRKKAQIMIAFGSCSQLGGIPGLANMFTKQQVLDTSYQEVFSVVNTEKTYPQASTKVPEGTVTLPELFETVKTLDQVVDVDYFIPGCPPPTKLLVNAVTAILEGKLPPKGTILAPDMALCNECARKDSKPEKPMIKEFFRPHQIKADPEKCLLAQGLVCLGPGTRSGCEAACVQGNMPCSGCLGPTDQVKDYGAKVLSAIASLADSNDDAEIEKILDGIPDPVGTFYRYSLPASLLHRKYLGSVKGGNK